MGIFNRFRSQEESSIAPDEITGVTVTSATAYKLVITYPDGAVETDDDLFDTYEEAEAAGLDASSCYRLGGEILNASNPGDYPLDDDGDGLEFEVVEVEA